MDLFIAINSQAKGVVQMTLDYFSMKIYAKSSTLIVAYPLALEVPKGHERRGYPP